MHNQATFFFKKEIKFGKRSIGLFQNMNEITKKIKRSKGDKQENRIDAGRPRKVIVPDCD